MQFWKKSPTIGYLFALLGCSVLLVSPQIILQRLVVSSDSLFHFNRFYDTAMQIKEGNLQYFVSFYGFQQSGRIVNALYGPIVAYLHGGLVMLSPNWFFYQISANFLLYVLAGYSMYVLLRTCKIRPATSFLFSVVYLTTYAIQYWMMRQGFSSWGAAILPLCLIPYMQWMGTKKFDPLKIGVSVALAVQVHLMTAFFVVLIYAFGLIGIVWQKKQVDWSLCWKILQSIVVFLFLTANIWLSMLLIYHGNTLLPPFVNLNMHLSTITTNSNYWLVTPAILFAGVFLMIGEGVLNFRKLSFDRRMLFLPFMFFVLLSTNIVPWRFLVENHFFLAELIQFPFRFFIPATTLMMVYLAKRWQEMTTHPYMELLVIVCAIGHCLLLNTEANLRWHEADDPFQTRKHTTHFSENIQLTKEAFHSPDKQAALLLIQKGTPDYVPIYGVDDVNKYEAYTQQIILSNQGFEKVVQGNQLVLRWQGEEGRYRQLPLIIYDRTKVHFNGASIEGEALQLTTIGAPMVKENSGINQMIIAYPLPRGFLTVLCVVLCLWVLVIGNYGKRFVIEVKSSRMKAE